MKTTVNFFRTLLLAVLTLTFGACGEDSLLAELGLDGQTSTKVDGAGEVWDGTVATAFAGGSGTAEDPYQIADGAQLAKLAQDVNGGNNYAGTYFVLTADILLNDISNWTSWNENTAPTNTWTPIGNSSQPFTGTLDGDGHSVSGIYISTANYQGLVGYLGEGGTLQNLGVKASYIKGSNVVGGLCGQNQGNVTNCYNTGSVTGTGDYVGGVCGLNFGNVTNCYNSGTVAGSSQVGGVCGMNMMGSVTNCYNAGNVTGTGEHVGGVCGQNNATVTNCYNSGSVAGSSEVGGVCGRNDGNVSNCYNTGSVEGNYSVGGVCGMNYSSTVTNCYYQKDMAAGGINGSDAAGQAEAKTADEFQSGEVASLLGDGWGQTIGTDDSPVLTTDASKKVYALDLYNGTPDKQQSYANIGTSFLPEGSNAIALVDADSPFKTGTNIVVKDGDNNYTCAELVLTDGADFYTPVAFTATNATYTRTPSVWATNNGSGSGWETICLPFSGTLYAGEEAKQPVDVASNNGAYWLRSLTGFETPNTLIFASPATAADHQIEAGVPYIIALPGETFGGESLEGQTISVRGTNVTVTNEAQSVAAGSMFAFTGTFATKACDAASYRLNSENGSNGAGNLFVLDTKELAPFRCRIDVTGLNIGGASTRSASGLPKELRIGQ